MKYAVFIERAGERDKHPASRHRLLSAALKRAAREKASFFRGQAKTTSQFTGAQMDWVAYELTDGEWTRREESWA